MAGKNLEISIPDEVIMGKIYLLKNGWRPLLGQMLKFQGKLLRKS